MYYLVGFVMSGNEHELDDWCKCDDCGFQFLSVCMGMARKTQRFGRRLPWPHLILIPRASVIRSVVILRRGSGWMAVTCLPREGETRLSALDGACLGRIYHPQFHSVL